MRQGTLRAVISEYLFGEGTIQVHESGFSYINPISVPVLHAL